MAILYFVFFGEIEGVKVDINLRVSLWLEENSEYLMPCQFKEVLTENNFYSIKVEALDPDEFIYEKHLDKKFLFGHPGKVIGYGILKKIARCR